MRDKSRPDQRLSKRLKSVRAHEKQLEEERGNQSDDEDHQKAEQIFENRRRLEAKLASRPKRQKVDGRQVRLNPSARGRKMDMSDEEIEANLAFCCHRCRCSKERKDMYGQLNDDPYIEEDGDGMELLWHRRCCHGVSDEIVEEGHWISPWTEATEAGTERTLAVMGERENLTDDEKHWDNMYHKYDIRLEDDVKAVHQRYLDSKRFETQLYREDHEHTHANKLRLENAHYREMEKEFRKLEQSAKESPKKKAVVLELFAGIGAGIVCLKRLGIGISKIVRVEHDKVATFVYDYWHCQEFKDGDDEDIEYVTIRTFESFEKNLELIKNTYGPFDLVIGGPPCVDYSGVNANRQGVSGAQGSYLPRMGEAVQRLQKLQPETKLFFLAENVVFRENDKGNENYAKEEQPLEKEDMAVVIEAFGGPAQCFHINLDSRVHTPVRRNRSYFSNIPIADFHYVDPHPSSCLEGGFSLVQHIFEPDMEAAKMNCLMASKGRLDDRPRMSIYKEFGNKEFEERSRDSKFEVRTPNVLERERLMGLKEGYVSKPVHELFQMLLRQGFARNARGKESWHQHMPEELKTFAGDYHRFKGKFPGYKLETNPAGDLDELVLLNMAPPLATKKPDYYTADEYAKRLIGNTFAIPTVEVLLEHLKPLFEEHEYPDFHYKFRWEQDSPHDWSTKRSKGIDALIRQLPETLPENYKSNAPDSDDDEEDDDNLLLGDHTEPNAGAAVQARRKEASSSTMDVLPTVPMKIGKDSEGDDEIMEEFADV